jgi:hypothetical protein
MHPRVHRRKFLEARGEAAQWQVLTVINHQFYKSTRVKRRVKMSFTIDLGVLN